MRRKKSQNKGRLQKEAIEMQKKHRKHRKIARKRRAKNGHEQSAHIS